MSIEKVRRLFIYNIYWRCIEYAVN